MTEKLTDAERAIQHEKDLKRLAAFRLMDDAFMRVVLKDRNVAQHVLRILTGLSDLEIEGEPKTQADMKRVTGARSICLDVYATDKNKKKYDLEIQKADEGAHPKRARYHSSVIDVENLDVNQKFDELPETYVIFITEKDFFGRGEPYYLFERIDSKSGDAFGDDEHILYINGAYRGNDEIGRLMHDFNCADPDDMYYEDLANRSRYYKESKKGAAEMSSVTEEIKQEAREDTLTEAIINLVNNKAATNYTNAMTLLGIPSDEQEKYKKLLKI